jgi:transposase-like protein
MAKDEKVSAEEVVRDIRRQTRRKYSAEEKIRIVLEGLRGEESIAELCRREGINPNMYYSSLLRTRPPPAGPASGAPSAREWIRPARRGRTPCSS